MQHHRHVVAPRPRATAGQRRQATLRVRVRPAQREEADVVFGRDELDDGQCLGVGHAQRRRRGGGARHHHHGLGRQVVEFELELPLGQNRVQRGVGAEQRHGQKANRRLGAVGEDDAQAVALPDAEVLDRQLLLHEGAEARVAQRAARGDRRLAQKHGVAVAHVVEVAAPFGRQRVLAAELTLGQRHHAGRRGLGGARQGCQGGGGTAHPRELADMLGVGGAPVHDSGLPGMHPVEPEKI